MSDLHRDDREFAQSVGCDPNHLDWLVKDAPPVAEDVRERIRRRVQANVANPDAAPAPPAAADSPEAPALSRHSPHFARAAAAAVLMLLVSGTVLVATSEAAQERLKELFRLVPGFGITATTAETRVLAGAPLAIQSTGTQGAVLAVVADKTSTEVRLKIAGLPPKDGRGPTFGESNSTGMGAVADLPALLVLPDGSLLSPRSTKYHFENGTLVATLEFGALPEAVNSVRFQVPSYRGLPLNVAVTLTLTGADTAQYTAAIPSDAAAEQDGIKVESLQYALEGDLIRFNLGVAPTDYALRITEGHNYQPAWVTLTDNNGHSYPLSVIDSDRLTGRSRTYPVAFTGPLQKGAKALTLTVPVVYVQEEGSTPYELDVTDLAVGDSRVLNQPIQVGTWPVTIEKVSRTRDDKFTFTIDLGQSVGNRALDALHSQVRKTYTAFNGWTEHGKQTIMVDISPAGGVIGFDWTAPTVAIHGPWVVTVPVK